jgi:hypothetical protein
MHIPETLKNALLTFVVVMLVYVLYQRLLIILGKKKRDKRYVTLGEKIDWNGRKATIGLTLYMDQEIAISIFDASGKEIRMVSKNQFQAGFHSVEVDCSDLQPGRYYFRITATAHDSSVYFHID